MAFETLFVPAIDENSFTPSLDAALAIAKKAGRHILSLHVTERYPSAHIPEAYWHHESIKAYEAVVKAQAEKLESLFYAFCRDQHIDSVAPGDPGPRGHVSASWATRTGQHYQSIALAARQSDLVVLTLPETGIRPPWHTLVLEALLEASGVPLLLSPEARNLRAVPTSVLVAWNGSAEARRALVASEPFLHAAERVHVVSVGDLNPDEPTAEDMARYLKRKGIEARHEAIAQSRMAVPDHLIETGQDVGAELLVMGAYSHAKWREFILGGVTRSILNAPPMPVFLAH